MLKEILVMQSYLESEDEWDAIDSISMFAQNAGMRGYTLADLPKEVLWNSQVTNAYVQINRNGPSLYFYNVLADADGTPRWDLLVDATRQGLRALGDVPQVEAYEKIISEYIKYRDEIVEGRKKGSHFEIPNNRELAREFMPSGVAEDDFAQRRAEWVRGLPNVRAFPDAEYKVLCDELLGPLKDES